MAFHIILDNGAPQMGELHIHTDRIEVTSFGGRPDPSWDCVDSNGHYHAYSGEKFSTPTLESRTKVIEDPDLAPSPNDWGCHNPQCLDEDHECPVLPETVSTLHCRICGEEVMPGITHDLGPRYVPGRTEWWVRVRRFGKLGDMKSVRIIGNGPTKFGIGVVSQIIDDHGQPAMQISGITELGTRKHNG